MTVKEYAQEFYKLNIRAGHVEDDVEKVARYINGLRYDIQGEINLLNLKIIEDAYQASLKEEEKIQRKQNQRNQGKSSVRGRGAFNPDFNTPIMKQEAQVADHHREETLVKEGLYPEVEAEEEKLCAIHVVNGDMGHGTFLIINQQLREM